MWKVKKPQHVKLVIGMLAKNEKLFDDAEKIFVKRFGKIDYKSPVLLFNHTEYYKKEMGHPLKRKFVSFKQPIPPQDISKIKLITNSLEKKLANKTNTSLKRPINIDPGYVSDSKLILATTKEYYHRIYLERGIYAEVTLTWQKGSFRPFEWTYPDYKTKEYIDILNNIRGLYLEERKTYGKKG